MFLLQRRSFGIGKKEVRGQLLTASQMAQLDRPLGSDWADAQENFHSLPRLKLEIPNLKACPSYQTVFLIPAKAGEGRCPRRLGHPGFGEPLTESPILDCR